MVIAFATLFLLLIPCIIASKPFNDRPIIGVLGKPLSEEYPYIKTNYTEVIEASYVQYINSAGGRVVPLSYKLPLEELRKIMPKLNGLLIPGGDTKLRIFNGTKPIGLTEFTKGAERILNLAMEMNKHGIYFPVWGTCMGFEIILMAHSGNLSVLTSCKNCINYSTFLDFTKHASQSRMLHEFKGYYRHLLGAQNLTYNWHVRKVDNDTFYSNLPLVEQYNILSHSPSYDLGQWFISAIEGKKYPVYGTQFHPEKWTFEVDWEEDTIKTRDTVTLGHLFATFFVEECRNNKNQFNNYKEELANLVENRYLHYDLQYGGLYLF
eukprot:TRINITY_DN136782_c0_g1_i1.p1 TRINITY_DN136782_c0_g1~~TRINITY_DN136782_c0_g1_i1.p1  ORF type:complete len:322 (+),score=31.47 TRINITY_DN136782_c0_g1_i1:122-1087(+)